MTAKNAEPVIAARELLAFYVDSGVDAALGETPIDHLAAHAAELAPTGIASGAATPRARSSPERIEVDRIAPAAPPSPDAAVMAAREAARSAATLTELRSILEAFDGCILKLSARRLVFADGNPQARLMLVGEAPGQEEDIEGLPFVGRSGQLLDRMLAAIGIDRSRAYIANIIPWRPPGNRTPTPQESQICLPFIRRQIELADPDVLVTLGNPATQALLGSREGIKRTRGRWHAYHTGTRDIRAMPTFHPAYLLRSPLDKRYAWRDFLAIKKALEE